jgi:hypothetical protein
MKKKSNFRDKVGKNIQQQRESKKAFGYLNLPKGVPILSIEDGTARLNLDFLPYEVTDAKHPDRNQDYDIAMPETLWYRRPIKVHRNVGSSDDTVICPRSVGQPCPICEYREKRAKEGADKEDIKVLYPKPRSLYVVVPLGVKKFEEKPTIWDMSDYLFQDILNDELELDAENRVFPELETGKTLSLRLKWKSLGGNSYPEVRSITFTDRDPYDEAILDDVPNLDEILKVLTYAQLKDKFFEIEHEPDGGTLEEEKEEKEEKPPRRGTPSTKRREESEEVKEEETDTPPARTRKYSEPATTMKRKAPVAQEEEKEEPPTRTKKVESSGKERCPHGHKFGVDTDNFEECADCNIWDDCIDKKQN